MENTEMPRRMIRAAYTDDTVTVYQAYRPAIGDHTALHGRFPESWSRSRMTWIKPSFLWMMYRSGWGRKEGQERVLALDISRDGFGSALRRACLSHFDRSVYPDRETWAERVRSTQVRVQWDPERDLLLRPLPYRSLQLGLTGRATRDYADHWIVGVRDVTVLAHRVHELVRSGDREAAAALLPRERPYPLDEETAAVIGATPEPNGRPAP
ncbi:MULTISPECIES: DUF4291 domain-containing protein [unclassified Streptomyces]|uniref:DUF4291 domain-containing protein n=1 Tax=unclassified Streptomyces TaxID=2593676 RepID=UPI00036FC78A|nr:MULTISPECIES: DUF4291 domain-containing protein [unclassified Streptomyces]MYX38424.1 DUF4291 family protein [Streptomyces sp. SID8377]